MAPLRRDGPAAAEQDSASVWALSGRGEGGRIHTVVELYRKVRLACRDGMSERAAARHFGVSFDMAVGTPLGGSAPLDRRRQRLTTPFPLGVAGARQSPTGVCGRPLRGGVGAAVRVADVLAARRTYFTS